MDAGRKSDMKVPSRPAPTLPKSQCFRKTQSHTLDLLSLGNDPFGCSGVNSENSRQSLKKKPPPRPPPPKCKTVSQRKSPSNFLDIFGRTKDPSRSKAATAIVKPLPPVQGSDVAIDSLIDLHSPSISPTLTKSSSSGVSLDSFNSLQGHNYISSQVESGFEDDFMSSSSTTPSNDPFSDCLDPFSPTTKSSLQSHNSVFELSNEDPKCKLRNTVTTNIVTRPTIIRVKPKPSRPPPPSMNKMNSENFKRGPVPAFNDFSNLTPLKGPFENEESFQSSPPMPKVPPPPPPPEVISTFLTGPPIPPRPLPSEKLKDNSNKKKPYCVAEYNYEGTHPDDLNFREGDVITLLSKVNDDWLSGSLHGKEGIFPVNYVNVVVPLNEEPAELNMTVISLFPFTAETWDDLTFEEGEEIRVLKRINENWLYGECDGRRGQFPENFVQDITNIVFNDSL